MFAIKYCSDLGSHVYSFKIFETVKAARQWWINHIGSGGTPFIDMLFVIPPGVDAVQWCNDNCMHQKNGL